MIIKSIPVESINPAPYNPRIDLVPGDEEYERIKKSIEVYGYVEPLVWNERTGNLVGGHQRFKVLMEKNPEKIDVSCVDLDMKQERMLNIALNKVQGDWDEYKLNQLLEELHAEDVDLELTGFSQDELNEILGEVEPVGTSNVNEDKEIDLEEFEESGFDHKCPKCGFYFNS